MSETNASPRTSAKKKHDKRVKLIFLLIMVAIAVTVWFVQNRGLPLDWPDDIDAAMTQAKEEDRRVLAFFISSSPSESARNMGKITLNASENKEAIKNGNFIKVKVETSLKSDVAEKYNVTTLPTMLILAPDGKELNRREGFVTQTEFPEDFLGLKKIDPPSKRAL